MAKTNSYEAMAREAVERIAQQRDLGQQLTFLPDERAQDALPTENAAKRGKGKALNQMREFMAAKGYRMPEEVLIQMAGLTSDEDAMLVAMQRAEQVLTWAYAGATETKKGQERALLPSPTARMRTFENIYSVMLRANDALMPYGTPKATPDAGGGVVVQVNVPAAPAPGTAHRPDPRDVTPKSDGRMMPADVRHEIEQKQGLSDAEQDQSDSEGRTE